MTRLRPSMRVAALVVGLTVPAVGFSSAALAAPGEWTSFHREFSFVEENGCGVPGLTLEHVFVSDGRERSTAHGPDGLPFFASIETVEHTVTNTAGESVTQVIDLRYASLHVTDNGDGTLTDIGHRTAHIEYVHDGQVIARGAGYSRVEGLWDHGGTPTDPSDDEFLDEREIKNVGNPVSFCATIVPAIG
jgi:hypothetical protein